MSSSVTAPDPALASAAMKLDPGEAAPALPPRTRLPPPLGPAPAPALDHYERILEKEEDLRRIHHRSRELMCGPAPPAPRCRPRVQSPSRDDYKDFSSLRHRDLISPCRTHSYCADTEPETGSSCSAESLSSLVALRQLGRSLHQLARGGCPHRCCSEPAAWCGHGGQPRHDHDLGLGHYPLCPHPDTTIQLAVENRLLALEDDKQLLQLQFAQMSDRIQSQSSKVTELQHSLQRRTEDLRHTEESLHQEVVSRSQLETRKLELLTEISGLKLRHTEVERENQELRRRLNQAEGHNNTNNTNNTNVGFRPVYRPRSEPQPSARESSPVRGATHFLVRSGPVFRSPASPGPAPATSSAHAQQPIVKKSRGWRKLWSRMKRSHSVHIPHAEDGDRDGGSRAGSISCESLGKF